MNSHFFDDDLPPDASRTFRPVTRRRDYSTLRLIAAIVLVAIGCALLITAGNPSTVGL
jgi:hypothetical protein